MNVPNDVIELKKHFEGLNYKINQLDIEFLTDQHETLIKDKLSSFVAPAKIKGIPILKAFNRIVIGAHGPYVEFEAGHLLQGTDIPKHLSWRLNPKYNVKYFHLEFNHPELKNIKIYHQVRTVNYADYKVGKFYIDFWEFF